MQYANDIRRCGKKRPGDSFIFVGNSLMNPLATSWPSLLAADGKPLCFASLNISPNRGVSFNKGHFFLRVACYPSSTAASGGPPSPLGRLPSGLLGYGGSGCPECEARRNTLGVPPPYCKLVALFCVTVRTVPYCAVANGRVFSA